jgi:hypothetical protein
MGNAQHVYVPADGIFLYGSGLRHLPLADARQNYTSFRYTKKRRSRPLLAHNRHP